MGNPSGAGSGDGNGDGIPDREQPDVASLPNAADGGYVTLVSNDGSPLQAVKALTPTVSAPVSVSLPYGLLSFGVSGLTPGGSYSATLILHTGSPPEAYWKFGPTPDNPAPHWYDFAYDRATGAVVDGNRVTLYFVDGGRGDGDVTANGVIADPGGPARSAVHRLWLARIGGLSAPHPDLVVDALAVWNGGARVVVRNAGDAPVTEGFWLDVYLAPERAPNGVNQLWSDLGSQGLVWGVTGGPLPLLPGQSITLTLGDRFYSPEHSHFTGGLAAGAPVYAQVDSWNPATLHGAVLEGHEVWGGGYNNIGSSGIHVVPLRNDLM